MNLKALITTLVLGSSSVAMAHPVSAPAPVSQPVYQPVYQPPVYQPVSQPIYRGPMPPQYAPGYEPTVYQPRYQHASWVSLGSVDHIVDGQMTFRLGRAARGGRFSGGFAGAGEQFSTLKLQSEAGKSLIQRVLIQFSNGRTQVVEVNQYLNASNPELTIDLEGRTRSIAKVTVIGRNARQSAYRVLAI